MNEPKLILSECREAMSKLEANSVDSIVTDAPYGLAFMGADFDTFHAEGKSANLAFQESMTPIFAEALRVAKPGAHLLAFGGTRTYHRLACAIEDAGWEIRDCIMWVYGCLSEDTEIATPQGWKRRGEIKVGDMVFAFDKVLGYAQAQPVQRVFDYDYDDNAYRIVSPLTDQLVSKNHRVLAEVNGVLDFVYAEFLHENDTVRVPVYSRDSRLSDFGMFIGQHEMTTARVSLTHYNGRMWCVSVPSGAIVARRNGKIFVTGNSGFPKSLDVAKAIDKSKGLKGEKIGERRFGKTSTGQASGWHVNHVAVTGKQDVFALATDEAKQWNGYGTCLKPACEPIVIARKPLEGTVAANVLKYGTGAINIDACRVPLAADDKLQDGVHHDGKGLDTHKMGWGFKNLDRAPGLGRFPANLIHDGSEEVLALFPDSKGALAPVYGKQGNQKCHTGDNGIYGRYEQRDTPMFPRNDSGSAARFFYCAKASRSERNKSCERLLQWEQNQELTQLLEKSNQLLKDISESMMQALDALVCNMTSFGNDTTVQFQVECKSIISTATKLITALKTSPSSPLSTTSGAILDAIKTSEESGINVVQLAERLNLLKLDSTNGEMATAINAVNALFAVLSEIRGRAKQGNHHVTIKPLALMRYLVRLVTRKGGIVLDPFMGSGTTGVAAIQEGMNFIGIERDPHYYEIASRRVNGARQASPKISQQELEL